MAEVGLMHMKKGFFYTISIFLLAAVFFEFVVFSVEQRGRVRADSIGSTDAEALGSRISALAAVSSQAIGANLTFLRNSTNLTIMVSDMGFPLTGSSGTKINSINASYVISRFANLSGTQLSADLSYTNSTGVIFRSSSGINYTVDNSLSYSDNATLNLPPAYGITRLKIRANCSMPSADSVTYDSWNNPSGTQQIDSVFNTTSPASDGSASSLTTNLSSNNFSADFFSSGTWIGRAAMWSESNSTDSRISVWSVVNISAGKVKNDISCYFTIASDINFTATSQAIEIFIPIGISAAYGNAGYIGNLTVARA